MCADPSNSVDVRVYKTFPTLAAASVTGGDPDADICADTRSSRNAKHAFYNMMKQTTACNLGT